MNKLAENKLVEKKLVLSGIYQHYKGDYYEVLDCARHSETLEYMVVYRALYGDFGLWVRPADMFAENIEINGESKPRFTFQPGKTSAAFAQK